MAHAEVHILYITFVELAGLFGYLLVSSSSWPWVLAVAIVCGLLLCSSLATDIKQHRYELRSILSAKSYEEIKKFLAARGYEMKAPAAA
jgi:hypothetical protein